MVSYYLQGCTKTKPEEVVKLMYSSKPKVTRDKELSQAEVEKENKRMEKAAHNMLCHWAIEKVGGLRGCCGVK